MAATRRRRGSGHPLRSFFTAAAWHRRLLAAGLAAAATAAALAAAAPPQAPSIVVVVAAHDLAAGQVLDRHDLRLAHMPAGLPPTHAFTRIGAVPARALLAPARAGTPLTDLDFIDPHSLSRLGPGLVAAPVRIADAASLSYVRVGDRIDVLAAATVPGRTGAVGTAAIVASDARVIAAPSVDGAADSSGSAQSVGSGSLSTGDGGLLVLAVDAPTARVLAGAAVTSRLSVALRPAH